MTYCVVMPSPIDETPPPRQYLQAGQEYRRPSHQSLQLDLEGLDLGGPQLATGHSNPLNLPSPSNGSIYPSLQRDGRSNLTLASLPSRRNGLLKPKGPGTPIEDTFVAHLRSDCVDANEILSVQKILDGQNESSPSSSRNWAARAYGSPSVASQQVLGGFASLGAAALGRDAADAHVLVRKPSSSHFNGDRRTSVKSVHSNGSSSSIWQSMVPQACEALRLLDIPSIEEMGKHSINMGNRDDWEGAVLVPTPVANGSSDSARTQVSWMAARSTHGKCKWLTAPVVSDEEMTANRTIVVSDKALSTKLDPSRKPPPAFSGLASFELRPLREDGPLGSSSIILANPSTLRLMYGRKSLTASDMRRGSRRADSFAGSTDSSPSLITTTLPHESMPRLRRTRSRPAIKYGALDHYNELSARDQQIVQSLVDSGLVEANMVTSSPLASFGVISTTQRRRSIDAQQRLPDGFSLDQMSTKAQHLAPPPTFGDYSMHFPSGLGDTVSQDIPDPPVSPSDASGFTQNSRPFIMQTQSFEESERTKSTSNSSDDLDIAKGAESVRFRIKKQPSSFGGWLKKKISGNSQSVNRRNERREEMASVPHLYGRRGSASDDNIALNAGKSDRKKVMGGSHQRAILKTRPSRTTILQDILTAEVAQSGSSDAIQLPTSESAPAPRIASLRETVASASPLQKRYPRYVPCFDPLLGLSEIPESALSMLLPLSGPKNRAKGRARRYLRVAFVPFDCRMRDQSHACVGHCAPAADTIRTSVSPSSMITPPALPQWYRRLGKTLGQEVAGPSASGSIATQSGSSAPSCLSAAPSSPEAFLFGAGPAPKLTEAAMMSQASSMDNRRTSTVEAFRLTAQVVAAPMMDRGFGKEDDADQTVRGPPLPPLSTFPVVLGVCFAGRSLEFLAEGWEALNLGRGPSTNPSDPMFGVADLIISACAAVMDL